MDFSLTAEQAALQATARRYAREQMAPVAREIEASGEPLSPEWVRRYAEMGFLGINVAEGGGQAAIRCAHAPDRAAA